MTAVLTIALLVAAAVVAVADWVAVARVAHRLERVLKPLTLALLVAAAMTADLGPVKPFVVAALVLGLIGDVALLDAAPEGVDVRFLAGLSAFAVGHVLYLAVFVGRGLHPLYVLAGLLIALGSAGLTLRPVLRGAERSGGRRFASLVGVYAALVAATAVLAVGTGIVATAVGGVAFLASDALLGRERFVARTPRGDLAVIVAYHLAQGLILLGLIRSF